MVSCCRARRIRTQASFALRETLVDSGLLNEAQEAVLGHPESLVEDPFASFVDEAREGEEEDSLDVLGRPGRKAVSVRGCVFYPTCGPAKAY